MRDNLSLFELLSELVEAELQFRRSDDLLEVALISLPKGRQLIAIERTYRDGTRLFLDPTPEEIDTAKSGVLSDLWNSQRNQLLISML